MKKIKDNREYLDRIAKKLFSLPTFEDLSSKLRLDDESTMSEEEFESEDRLRMALANKLYTYLKEKGLYNKDLNRHIWRFVAWERTFSLYSNMFEHGCDKCPHLKELYNEMLSNHDGALTDLGILRPNDDVQR